MKKSEFNIGELEKMKPLEIDWKDKNIMLKFGLDKFDKKQLGDVCSDVIDLLRKKHKLSPIECAFVLDNLLESLQDTIAQFGPAYPSVNTYRKEGAKQK